ncbi:MAG: alanine--tRNA ligase [Candidatus Omnitrophica bacterium]|nr:alanine--tRNA ligase [Candidatus Omnitrophota bacterium]
MKADELRRRFLEFFRGKGHVIVPSDSLVPANDPSLLFTGAGMNQFKEHFLGLRKEMKRAASSQRCFRTGDVEQVGRTPGHLTFFEMLGNFSFGDYFKKEAILWAWEFFTRELKIAGDRLWATVYEKDDEAAGVWRRQVGLAAERVVRMGARDNFWPSNAPADGPNGPCGPCSELHYDYGCCTVGKVCPDPDHCKPGCPCGRFVEVWNLVFTQYDRQSDGSLKDLPAKNIDTGMGLERLAAVMQGKMSVFETDLFQPIVSELAGLVAAKGGERVGAGQIEPIRAIADHARALTFLVSEGIVPSNDGRGYVLRMLLRKAERAGIGLGLKRPFLYTLVPVVAKVMEGPYPELAVRREGIAQVILSEEERFRQMLEEKMPLLEQVILEPVGPHESIAVLEAETAAQFYDTHGLSYEEIVDVCRKHGVKTPSRAEFEKALAELQAKSKKGSGFSGAIFTKDSIAELVSGIRQPTEFTGYSELTGRAKVLAVIRENHAGFLEGPGGKMRVVDTQWVGNLLVHEGEVQQGAVRVGEEVTGIVDAARRRRVAQNHTATHLLHAALRKVLGPHVAQAGSLVAPDRLRLDFSHGQGLSGIQRDSVESLVNEWVERNLPVRADQMAIDEAKRAGAMALFGEKYGSQVRVVSIGDVSKELCGGTHLKESGGVGPLTIVEEGSIASGVRRVEALTDRAALDSREAEVVRLQQEGERLRERNRKLEEEKRSLKVEGAA